MQQRITKQFLDSVPINPSKDQFFFDPKLAGFGVKVTRSGRKNFIVNARIKGQHPKRVTIGQYPEWQITDARDEALQLLKKLREGIDPIKQKRDVVSQARKTQAHHQALNVSLDEVIQQYMLTRTLKPKTQYDYRNTLNKCFADWLDKPIRTITRRNIEDRYIFIQKNNRRSESDSGLAQAKKAMRILKSIMNFAAAEDIDGERLITDNPVQVLHDKKLIKALPPRTRTVPLDALWKIVRTFEWLPNKTAGDLMTLLLYTGLRLNEATQLTWNNIHFDKHYLIVPDTKNGTDHFVPIPSDIEHILITRKTNNKTHSSWVFPNINHSGPVINIRKSVEKATQVSSIAFTCHDLRRTFATIADCCGLDHMTIKRVLNHKHKDITQQYIQRKVDDLRKPMNEIQNFIRDSIMYEENKRWLIEHLGEDFAGRVHPGE